MHPSSTLTAALATASTTGSFRSATDTSDSVSPSSPTTIPTLGDNTGAYQVTEQDVSDMGLVLLPLGKRSKNDVTNTPWYACPDGRGNGPVTTSTSTQPASVTVTASANPTVRARDETADFQSAPGKEDEERDLQKRSCRDTEYWVVGGCAGKEPYKIDKPLNGASLSGASGTLQALAAGAAAAAAFL